MATYVCSDIHGLSHKYYELLNTIQLKEDDVLYVLGDVIDRGPDGFQILVDVLQRNNVRMLLGNHEQMMLDVLEENNGEIPNGFSMSIFNWMLNGSNTTVTGWRAADEKTQQFVWESLKRLPYAYTDVEVNGRTFYLCHTSPGKAKNKPVLYKEDVEDPLHFVWDRMEPEGPFLKGKTIIAGHTIVLNYHDKLEVYTDTGDIQTANYIDIDCGCAMNDEKSRLACIRLDDMEVIYI